MRPRWKEANLALALLIVAFVVGASMVGCAQKEKVAPIAGWDRYDDPYFTVKFTYPRGWHVVPEGGRVVIYSSPQAVDKFQILTSETPLGAQLMVSFEKLDSLVVLSSRVAEFVNDMTSSGFQVDPPAPATLDGVEASQVTYTGSIDSRTTLRCQRVYALKDSVLYYVHYAGFNQLFDAYRAVRDTLLASVKLPETRMAAPGVDPSLPSSETQPFANNFLEIAYPQNFEASFPKAKGEVQFSLHLKGYRQDSDIRVDVLPAKGLTVEKVVEQFMAQNAKRLMVTSRGEATVDGVKAPYVNYRIAREIDSRVYFMVKNDRVFQVIMNYYQPMKAAFLPAFEKTVASLRLK